MVEEPEGTSLTVSTVNTCLPVPAPISFSLCPGPRLWLGADGGADDGGSGL